MTFEIIYGVYIVNIYLKTILYATLAAVGAYILNVIFEYTDNNASTWLPTYVAFLVGTYIGLSYRDKKDKK